jgi:hypothetical protein
VHPDGKCQDEKSDPQQWGEWLRASLGKKKKSVRSQKPSMSSGSFSSRSGDAAASSQVRARVRDLPPRRNLLRDYTVSGSSRTGGGDYGREVEEVTSPPKNHRVRAADRHAQKDTQADIQKDAALARYSCKGTYTRRPRNKTGDGEAGKQTASPSPKNRKRRTKWVWEPKNGQAGSMPSEESDGKRQHTSSVFDRLEENLGVGEKASSVFDRLEANNSTSADPDSQGRRGQ